MTPASDPRHRPQRLAIVLTLIVGLIATAVTYLGTRENPQAPVSPPAAPVAGPPSPCRQSYSPTMSRNCPPGPISVPSSPPARFATRRGW